MTMTEFMDDGTDTAGREVVLERVFDEPRELVFDAWTDPRHMAHWWGPRGFTTTTREMDVRPGGRWRFVMHAPDGTDYDNLIVYLEVVRPERLVYDHADADGDNEVAPAFRVTARFHEHERGTRLTFRLLFPTAEVRRAMMDERASEGGKQTLERLAEYVATLNAGAADVDL
ncbi:uncharacterized protein YndB with AHSA1/START domain [Longimicrobium terrae]|uniref:Uncharacterized protein YndB with AHSA1/START domain n=2 Tax=Longimicrobium terrae TaxID=1639882 RepID=A0A841GWU5_9BACT|nr:SRPBCC family protein [Longimicrobium terrae]MBB4635401.1 uncharacterized protein YndB with AHSA1/START domain [Longimicrobium terrae]MBB6069795.1 uncharacterized protein YndB with AHSA1/START domain [Longimicrobium terrae]